MKHFKIMAALALVAIFSACGSLEQWSTGLRAIGNSMANTAGAYSGTLYGTSAATYKSNSYASPVSVPTEKEWANCSACYGSGKCNSCGGSGASEYERNGKCGVCRGNGRCVACNGKGGRYY